MKWILLGLLTTSTVFAQSLMSQSVKQYECLINGSQGLLGYFIPRLPPQPIPYSNEPVIVCHNTSYGRHDGPTIPRRNEEDATFKVWDGMNPLFFDNDGDGNMDVNNRIISLARSFGQTIPGKTNFFEKLSVRNHDLGYIMPFFVDQTTFKSYCLKAQHYQSTSGLFRAIGSVLGADTEGLYAGQRLKGDRDLLYVSESVLKKSWFYLANNRPVVPTEANAANVALYFVHEGDVFQIKGSAELNLPSQTVNYPAHDRKIGCVPTI
jgi:hypothetical protein